MMAASDHGQPDDGNSPRVPPIPGLVFFLSAFSVLLIMFTVRSSMLCPRSLILILPRSSTPMLTFSQPFA